MLPNMCVGVNSVKSMPLDPSAGGILNPISSLLQVRILRKFLQTPIKGVG